MDISRRSLLLAGAISPLAAVPNWAFSAENTAKTLFVVLDSLDATLPPALAAQVLGVFFAAGIPLGATLRCAPTAAGNNAFVDLFKTTLAQEPGLFEIVLDITPEVEAERYFRLRAAIDLRDCLLSGPPASSAPPIVSLLSRSPEVRLDPFALRAAGFRIQLHPKLDETHSIVPSPSQYEAIDWGVASLKGGDIAAILAPPMAVFPQTGTSSAAQVLYLSFAAVGKVSAEALLAQCQQWAARLQTAMRSENTFLTRPMDHLLQGHPGASKYVGLVLDTTKNPATMAAFASRMAAANLPFTTLTATNTAPSGDCVLLPDQAATARCVLQPADGHFPYTAADIVLHPTDASAFGPDFWSGPRRDGRFHAAVQMDGVASFAQRLEADPLTDIIFRVGPAHVATPVQQDALLAAFIQARQDGKAHFYSVQGFVTQTAAPDPVLKRFGETRRRQASDPPAPHALTAQQREALLTDARLAWRFIARYSDEETGICAGTVQAGSKNIVNQAVTLWDVASQLNGIQAAHALALIPQTEAMARVARVLAHVPAANIGGAMLPPALFNANTATSLRPEFDACDTGRFLIALNRVVAAGLASSQQASTLLETWDLEAAIQNRRPFNFEKGRWRDVSRSHCTHYARNGYKAWGLEVASPYPALGNAPTGDQHIRLLYEAGRIGHFGAEPVLLEGLELGYSPEAKYLSDVLFAAQISWFERTGRLKCVSETVLNFEPWFAYQGLRVDRSGEEEWVLSTISGDTSHQTRAFFEKADIISSKAAYLWAALYPHPYSDRLVALIRDNARIEDVGFSVGVFSQSQQAMQGYSDVNTNGVILAAIAQQLNAG